MNMQLQNEQDSATAFSVQSATFDALYRNDTIIKYKRESVRAVVQQFVKAHASILELNSGTGEDAIWFAQQGHTVHATDIAEGMQEILKTKVQQLNMQYRISTECISFTNLEHLAAPKKYDLIFSNFAGLNCTGELQKVLHSLAPLLKPQGHAILVILPAFCLWETMLLFKGKFKTACRRFFASKGRKARVEGNHFRCWYYNPSFVVKHTAQQFTVRHIEGLCSIVPPSYLEGFAEKYPRLFAFLKTKEQQLRQRWPWRSIGDYYIIVLEKK